MHQVVSTRDPAVLCLCVVITDFADKPTPNAQSCSSTWDCLAIWSASTAPPSTNYAALEKRKVRKCPDMKLTLIGEFLQLLKECCSGIANPLAAPLDTDTACHASMVIS